MNRWQLIFVAVMTVLLGGVASVAVAGLDVPPNNVDMSVYAKLADMPQPAAVSPQAEIVGGALGSSSTYMRSDAKIPRISRSAVVVTDGSGNWTVTWSTALPGASVVLPIPINSGVQPATCNVVTSTVSGASGRCWQAQSTLLNLSIITAGLTLNAQGGNAGSMSVQLIAIPTTQ